MVRQVVPVDRAVVAESEFLEEHRRHDEILESFLDAAGQRLREAALGDHAEQVPEVRLEAAIVAVARDQGQVARDRADVRRDAHLVVVEDHDEVGLREAGVVQALVGEAARERAVTDDGDDVAGLAKGVARARVAQRRAHGGAGVAHAERVVLALAALGEAGESAAPAQGAESVAASSQELVHVGLVADVPDDPVARRIEDPVQGDRQLHDAEAGAQMAPRAGHRRDDLVAQFAAELFELRRGQRLEVLGAAYLRQNLRHGGTPSTRA